MREEQTPALPDGVPPPELSGRLASEAYRAVPAGEPGDSLVTFELSPQGEGTRLKLTHTGIDTFPKTLAYARKNFETGWTQIVDSELRQFVERKKKA